MLKRRGGGQIGNLTPDHKSFKIRGQMRSDWVCYTPLERPFEGYKILPLHSQNKLDMNGQIFGTTKVPILGLSLGSLEEK
jgi:hypothetical protein